MFSNLCENFPPFQIGQLAIFARWCFKFVWISQNLACIRRGNAFQLNFSNGRRSGGVVTYGHIHDGWGGGGAAERGRWVQCQTCRFFAELSVCHFIHAKLLPECVQQYTQDHDIQTLLIMKWEVAKISNQEIDPGAILLIKSNKIGITSSNWGICDFVMQ